MLYYIIKKRYIVEDNKYKYEYLLYNYIIIMLFNTLLLYGFNECHYSTTILIYIGNYI